MKRHSLAKTGFTLIEMLVVVIIIASLVSVGMPQYFKVVESARITEAKSLLTTIRTGQEGRLSTKGSYAHSNDEMAGFDVNLPGQDPTYGMKFFFVVLGPGSSEGCPPSRPHYNVQFIRYSDRSKAMSRYFENYMMVYESCANKLSFPGCINCQKELTR